MDFSWLVPIAVPFVIGLLVGAAVKHAMKLIFILIALVAVLVFTGVISLSFSGLWSNAIKFLPQLFGAESALNLLPYTSIAFLVGLAIGLLKG
jgi:uncharacterized membrane protein (Fun14 family)